MDLSGLFPSGVKIALTDMLSRLTVPLVRIEKDYEAANPGIDILREAGGASPGWRMRPHSQMR